MKLAALLSLALTAATVTAAPVPQVSDTEVLAIVAPVGGAVDAILGILTGLVNGVPPV